MYESWLAWSHQTDKIRIYAFVKNSSSITFLIIEIANGIFCRFLIYVKNNLIRGIKYPKLSDLIFYTKWLDIKVYLYITGRNGKQIIIADNHKIRRSSDVLLLSDMHPLNSINWLTKKPYMTNNYGCRHLKSMLRIMCPMHVLLWFVVVRNHTFLSIPYMIAAVTTHILVMSILAQCWFF